MTRFEKIKFIREKVFTKHPDWKPYIASDKSNYVRHRWKFLKETGLVQLSSLLICTRDNNFVQIASDGILFSFVSKLRPTYNLGHDSLEAQEDPVIDFFYEVFLFPDLNKF